jgi:hypothetical protein
LRSVFTFIAPSAALRCRVSIRIAASLAAVSPACNHRDSGPASRPIRVNLLVETIEADRYPLSPRIQLLGRILGSSPSSDQWGWHRRRLGRRHRRNGIPLGRHGRDQAVGEGDPQNPLQRCVRLAAAISAAACGRRICGCPKARRRMAARGSSPRWRGQATKAEANRRLGEHRAANARARSGPDAVPEPPSFWLLVEAIEADGYLLPRQVQ